MAKQNVKKAFSFKGWNIKDFGTGMLMPLKAIGAYTGYLLYPGDEVGSALCAGAVYGVLSIIHYYVKPKKPSSP